MEQLVMMALQVCSEYAQKSASTPLTEYEMLMYEQLCNTVRMYMKTFEAALNVHGLSTLRGEEEEDDDEATGSTAQ